MIGIQFKRDVKTMRTRTTMRGRTGKGKNNDDANQLMKNFPQIWMKIQLKVGTGPPKFSG